MKKLWVMILLLVCFVLPAVAEETVFKLAKGNYVVWVGETLPLPLERAGDAQSTPVQWVTSNTKRASVDEGGVVTGLAKGEVTITAQTTVGKKTFRTSVKVTVKKRTESVEVNETKLPLYALNDPVLAGLVEVPATATDLGAERLLLMRVGQSLNISSKAMPQDASNTRTVLTSSDEAVVKVSGAKLTARAPGACVVTVASQQDPEIVKEYRVLAVQGVTKLKLSAPKDYALVGGTLSLTPEFQPEDAAIRAVTWRSSNTKVATVDESGVVSGLKKGSTVITATAADGSGRSASFKVAVKQQPTGVTLKTEGFTMNTGKVKTLSYTVAPRDTSFTAVVWESSDTSVATVDSRGRVTGKGPGVCTITCRMKEFPEVFATARAEILQPVTKVAFTGNSVSFDVGSSCQLFWQVSPANATDQTVTFKSSNTKVATVDANGVVTGLKRGSATITVTAADGSKKKDTVKVNVLQPVRGVHMENDTLRVGVDERLTAQAILEPADASNTAMTWYSEDETIATVKGSKTKPTVTGVRWGTTTITGVTEDGGYVTTATVNVGNYDRALKITDLYLAGNKIKIVVNNESNMNVTRFWFTIWCYDEFDAPMVVSQNGGSSFTGSYRLPLYEGDNTEHGRFYFDGFVQPEQPIGRVVMSITGYSTDTGYSRDIRDSRQVEVEFKSAGFVGPTPTPVPVIPPADATDPQP